MPTESGQQSPGWVMRPWWEKYPERLNRELASLDEAGFQYIEREGKEDQGCLVLDVVYQDETYTCSITICYPVEYPSTVFSVIAPEFIDGRHKEPIGGKLCLYHNDGEPWQGDCAGPVLKEQIPKILAIHRGADVGDEYETDAGVQITGQINYERNSVTLLENPDIPDGVRSGTFLFARIAGQISVPHPRYVLRQICSEDGVAISSSPNYLQKLAHGDEAFRGRWILLDKPPHRFDDHILDEAICLWPALAKYPDQSDLVALVFPAEVTRGVFKNHWVFVLRHKEGDAPKPGRKTNRPGRRMRKVDNRVEKITNVRADMTDADAVYARVSALSPIVDKHVMVVGVGAIGSNIAIQLARAGIRNLTLADYDYLTSGNSPRWIAGLHAAGYQKLDWLKITIAQNYPACLVNQLNIHIGNTGPDTNGSEVSQYIEDAFKAADLIIDASAALPVTRFINELSLDYGIPLVWGTGTAGGYGGVVGQTSGDWRQPCWGCYQRHIADQAIHLPPAEKGAEESVQTIGCFHPTFTGSGFDMDEVSLMTTRVAMGILCRGHEGAYPEYDNPIHVLSLRGVDGHLIPPKWEPYSLPIHPECDCHG